jgi:carboxymethylenebutenolidase
MSITHLTLPVEGGNLPLTVARSSGRGAAVVFVPSAFGVASDLEAQMDELATDASLVVAFDPFFRGDGGVADYEDMPRIMARIRDLDRARAYADLRATIDWARAQGADRVVVVGICFGATFALIAAADGIVDGLVSWHGTRMESFVDRAPTMTCPMHHHVGGVDPVVPTEARAKITAAFAGRDDVRIVVHEGATHGFTHRTSKAYDTTAERAAMQSVRDLVR